MAERRFPLLDAPSVPWEFMAPHEYQAKRNHDQSLSTLAGRGGLSPAEVLAIVLGQRWYGPETIRNDEKALPVLAGLVANWEATNGAIASAARLEGERAGYARALDAVRDGLQNGVNPSDLIPMLRSRLTDTGGSDA